MTEDQLKTAIIQLAELNGWMVYSIRRSDQARVQGHTGKGFPDLVLVRGGRILYRELKTERGKETDAQLAWLNALCEAGADVAIWRPARWLDGTIERALKR